MSFTALNLSAEDVELDAEEHTRELQIEQAFKAFQTALKLQKDLKFEEANQEYVELFKIEVVSDTSKEINSPNVKMLRYLAHRNRGLLRLEELKSLSVPSDKSLELFLTMIDDMIIALQYSDGDSMTETLLLAIFDMVKNDRLSRFILEYALSNEQNHEILIHERNRSRSNECSSYTKEYQLLLKRIGVLGDIDESRPELIKPDLGFLGPFVGYLEMRHTRFLEEESKTVKLESPSWKCIAVALNDLVPKAKLRNSKNEDAYTTCEDPIASISFTIPPKTVKSLESKESEVEETLDLVTMTVAEDEAKRKQEDVPQRSSKRVKGISDVESSSSSSENKFIEEFNQFLQHAGCDFNIDNNSFYSKGQNLCLSDFYSALTQWSTKHTEALFHDKAYQSNKDNSNVALSELFNSNSMDHFESHSSCDYLDDTSAAEFIEQNSGYHYIKVRKQLVFKLLCSTNGHCDVSDSVFEKELFIALEDLVLSAEFNLFCEFSLDGFISAAIAIYEILLNRWISTIQQQKNRGLTSKQRNELVAHQALLNPIILRWRKCLCDKIHSNTDEILKFRFQWASLLYLQHSQTTSIDMIKDSFNQLYEELKLKSPKLDIKFLNYKFIPPLNLEAIEAQSDKFNVITSFEKTFNSDNREMTINLLEKLLFYDNTAVHTEEEKSMIKFINEGPVNLHFKLWKVLLGHYFRSSNLSGYQKSINIVLGLLLDQLDHESYDEQSEHQRQQILVSALAFYCDYVDEFVGLIEMNGWSVPENDASELLEKLIRMFKILYAYILFEKSLKNVMIKNKSFMKIRDCIINTVCAILPLYGKIIHDDHYIRLFNVIHVEVGELKFCDAGNGRFLDLSQHLLKNMDSKEYEAEILQHMNCRFHIFICSDTFLPFDHGTKPCVLDKVSALQFSSYILGSISKKNFFFQSSFKQDLKHGLDVLYQTFGDPDTNEPLYQRNENQLDTHIDGVLDLKVFRDSLIGVFHHDFRMINKPEKLLHEQGIYFIEGVLNLNLYKSRKKAGQSKNSDLEFIIKVFRADLKCGTNRIESWFCLGQAYSFQAEDDLTWTSDKLNSVDKKLATASLQKKAILCYLTCVSLIVNQPRAVEDSIKTAIFGSLGRELYHSLTRPMDGFAFLTSGERKIMSNDNGIVEQSFEMTPEKKSAVLKYAYMILKIAMSFDKSEWLYLFYITKVNHKLGKQSSVVFKAALKCCELNSQGIEPHYYLCSLVYKYFRAGKLTKERGTDILRSSPLLKDVVTSEHENDDFINLIISSLKKLIFLDKRKWHHQPRTRNARIYFDLGEYKKAYAEMEPIIVLKSTTKNLVSIWKPEFEAPGKHFVYTTIYIDSFIKIASKMGDLQGLILFNRKLRRFGASMIDLPSAWDICCTAICDLIREIICADKNYTGIEVSKLIYSEFVARAEKILEIFKAREVTQNEISNLVLLCELSEIRRMNNGFGSTSYIDDTFNAIYLKIYLAMLDQSEDLKDTVSLAKPNQSTSTGPVKTKVARRDILAVASLLCKTVESKVKAHMISDEVGFSVPQDIVESRQKYEDPTTLAAALPSYNQSTPTQPPPDTSNIEDAYATSQQLTPNGEVSEYVSRNSADNNSSTVVPIQEDNVPKTPEKWTEEQDADRSKDLEEFHTPTENNSQNSV